MQNSTKKIILIGMKGCGKTTIGKLLSEKLQVAFIDSDHEIEKIHALEKNENLSFREIFKKYGRSYFNQLDIRTLKNIAEEIKKSDFVFACAGVTPLQSENQKLLAQLGTIIFLHVDKQILLQHILADGIPAFFPYQDNPEKSMDELLGKRLPTYKKLANITIDINHETPEEVANIILDKINQYEN